MALIKKTNHVFVFSNMTPFTIQYGTKPLENSYPGFMDHYYQEKYGPERPKLV
jgi:hypothetical protein